MKEGSQKVIFGFLVLILLALPVFSETKYWHVKNANLSINDTLFIDTTNSRVGIGVSEPSFPLHVRAGGNGYQSARFNGNIGINTDPDTSSGIPIITTTLYGQNTILTSGGTAYSSSVILRNGLSSSNTAVLEASSTTPRSAKLYSNTGHVILKPFSNYYVGINDLNPSAMLEVNGTGDLVRIGNDTDAILYVNGSNGNVGIGTTNPNKKLTVIGDANITGDVYSNGNVVSGIPSGAVMYFNLESCPSGWSELTSARGRYIVGMPSSGTLAGTAGTALTNLENRPVGQHSHSVNPPSTTTSSNGAHNHDLESSLDSGSGALTAGSGALLGGTGEKIGRDWPTSSILLTGAIKSDGAHTHSLDIASFSSGTSGSVAGTNAPYVQLLVCQKD